MHATAIHPGATRFAPSPTGFLHLGHVYSALFAERAARDAGLDFLLRIEDIDTTRCRPDYAHAIIDDLRWLGLTWREPIRRQSEHLPLYGQFLHILEDGGVTYPCFCTRKEIAREIAAAAHAPQGPDGPLYPGTCRQLAPEDARARMADGQPHAIRLNRTLAGARTGPLFFQDREHGRVAVNPDLCGDVVLARKDIHTGYHVSVVVDDGLQHVTLVTRGVDLLPATHVQRTLQSLMGLPEPLYHHHPLLTDDAGKRLAKRDGVRSIRDWRATGLSPQQVRAMAWPEDHD